MNYTTRKESQSKKQLAKARSIELKNILDGITFLYRSEIGLNNP